MSRSLLKKGLELVCSDSIGTGNGDVAFPGGICAARAVSPVPLGKPGRGGKKGFKKQPKKHKQNDALNSNKIGMKKRLRKLKHQGQPQNQRATAKDRVVKSAIEEYKKHASQDYLAQNLKYMLGSRSVANKNVVKEILNQHCGRKARDQKVKKKKRVQQKSVFSDSDFKRFEKEYFGSRQIVAK